MKSKLGFTNKLAISIIVILAIGLVLSFVLALYSIKNQYLGTLACWTVGFTPLGVGLDIVLNSTVKKSENENTGADGEGIRYRQLINEMKGDEASI